LNGSIRATTLIDEGLAKVTMLGRDGRQLDTDWELLDRLVLIPSDAELAVIDTEHSESKDASEPAHDRVPIAHRTGMLARTGTPVSRSRPTVVGQPTGIKINLWENALIRAREHAEEHCREEVGGMCIGVLGIGRHSGKWIVEITDTLVAQHTISRAGSITFTPDTWSAASKTVDRVCTMTEERIVGWYHSHPGVGIFLSPDDLFVHENFFT
ncbi:MAG TPA: Mov34/MPN/PAD-1 family protein, partial [Anaerolineae bacterium]|nr:Mov34/MPN/PAD-1 family protein [Anaerolineae bacterium]